MDAPDEEGQVDDAAPALVPPSIETLPAVRKPKVVKMPRPQLIKAGIVIDEEKWHGEAIDMVLSKYGKK
jgi:hypothetical protein